MKKLVILSVFLLPFLTGCSIFDFFRKNDNFPITDKVVVVDPKLLEKCPPVPRVVEKSKEIDFDQIGEEHVKLIGLYGECANRQLKSIEAIKKLSNTQEEPK